MPFDPGSRVQLKRLHDAVTFSYKALRTKRVLRTDAIKEFVGRNYAENGVEHRVPNNLIELAISVYTLHLAASNPRVLATTFSTALKPQAAELQVNMNQVVRDLKFSRTMRRVVRDAMFSMGIAKVAQDFSTGEPQRYFDRVSLDDWVHDSVARSMAEATFMGNRYRMDRETLLELYPDKERMLQPSFRFSSLEDGEDRTSDISQDRTDPDEFRQFVELWDIWLPDFGLIVTVPASGDWREPLSIVEWEGPQVGPYHFLWFSEVPDQAMPLAPVSVWWDLHELANTLWRKAADQAERQKTVGIVSEGGAATGTAVVQANDGDVIRARDPRDVNEVTFGGADPRTMAMMINVNDIFSRNAGNLDALGGLSPQAETLGQEQILAAASGNRISEMQDAVQSFAVSVITTLAEFEWNDNITVRELVREGPLGIQLPFEFSAQTRKGDFPKYDIAIEPYSMRFSAPQERLQQLDQLMTQILLPLGQVLPQMGIELNMERYLKLRAEYSNMPEQTEVVRFLAPPQETTVDSQTPIRSSPVTTRTNVRVNRPGATRQGKDEAMSTLLMGGGVQNDEAASLMRQVG